MDCDTARHAKEQTVLPPEDAESLAALEALLVSGAQLEVTASDRAATLPPEVRTVMAGVVRAMRHGQAITVAPHALRLTTQQAADLLGVSRPTLIKLLEQGKIPYETPSRHRRIRLADLLSYQALRREERRDALDELAREAQADGLYDHPGADYEAALTEARRKLA
jgi:excisionase family DNA binding protein